MVSVEGSFIAPEFGSGPIGVLDRASSADFDLVSASIIDVALGHARNGKSLLDVVKKYVEVKSSPKPELLSTPAPTVISAPPLWRAGGR
jgi:hypothetical protein